MREIMLEKAGRERSTWKRAAVITALIGGLALGTVYGCGVVYFWDKFLPGTTINHMDVSYRTVGEVEAQVADDVGKYRLIVDEDRGKRPSVPMRSTTAMCPPGRYGISRSSRAPFNGPSCFLVTVTMYFPPAQCTARKSLKMPWRT